MLGYYIPRKNRRKNSPPRI